VVREQARLPPNRFEAVELLEPSLEITNGLADRGLI
jgi:hypothetical protein